MPLVDGVAPFFYVIAHCGESVSNFIQFISFLLTEIVSEIYFKGLVIDPYLIIGRAASKILHDCTLFVYNNYPATMVFTRETAAKFKLDVLTEIK